ncbi:response regulator [Polaribacter sp. R77954]|uniref:response regulator n=1 Tax=Polaribacter sp. R77954 TaxID=3093870 RepID=UPI0037C9D076
MKAVKLFFLFACVVNLTNATALKDTLYEQELKDKYRTIFIKNKYNSLDEKEKIWNNFRAYITSEKMKFTDKSKNYNFLDSIEEHAIAKMISQVFFQKQQQDSIQFYYDFLNKKSTNYYLLGSLESSLVWSKVQNLDYVGAIQSNERIIELLEKSKHPKSQLQKISTIMNLTELYIFSSNFYLSNNMFLILDTELEKVKDEAYYADLIIDYKLLKAQLLKKEKKINESIKLAETISIDDIQNPYILEGYHFMQLENYIDYEMADKAQYHYDILFDEDKVKDTGSFEKDIHKNVFKVRILLLKNDFSDIKKYIKLLEEKPFEGKEKNIVLNAALIEYYKKTGNYRKAFSLLEKNSKDIEAINKINSKIQFEITSYNLTKDKEITDLKEINETKEKEIKRNQEIFILTILIILLIIIIISIIVYNYRNKKNLLLKADLEKSNQILSLKNNLLENIAHEIRTPITIIKGYMMIVKEHTLNPQKITNYTNLSLKNLDNLTQSLNSFLTLYKTENNNTRLPNLETKSLNKFLNVHINQFKELCESKKITLYFKTNIAEKTAFEYEYNSLQKIMENLITNAIKYSNSGTAIFVSVILTENGLKIIVKDEGFGIAKEEQEQIFSKYYQSKNHLISGGFGIGLSLVNQIVTQLKGTIKLVSELKIGSIFTVNLPFKTDNYVQYISETKPEFKKLTNTLEIASIETSNFPKALIVDDNLEMISYLKELFTPTLVCTYAYNGQEALKLAKENSFDIIISDLKMPLMDGMQFKEELNKIDSYKEIPFIMITAVSKDFLGDLKMTLGINDYIVKPFDKDEILTRVRALLENNVYKQNIMNSTDAKIDFKGPYSELINKINKIVIDNLENPAFNVKMLATEIGYSAKQLNTLLQAKIGITTVQVILEIRLLTAYDLILKNTYPTIGEAMYAVGFTSKSYFNQKFKTRFGIKPNDLKKKHFI